MKSKIKLNWFVDFDKEEHWLNEMAGKGLCLWHTNGIIYRFKECRQNEYIFQIDFDEKKSSTNEDYIVFRTSCGDKFVHQCKDKIYWKRIASEGPFESENNVQAKLRMTNKAYNHHIQSLIGLTLIMAFGCFICVPLGQYLIPESIWADQISLFGLGLASGILFAECVILIPAINKLRKKMNELIQKEI
jgi:hypothetical protein